MFCIDSMNTKSDRQDANKRRRGQFYDENNRIFCDVQKQNGIQKAKYENWKELNGLRSDKSPNDEESDIELAADFYLFLLK